MIRRLLLLFFLLAFIPSAVSSSRAQTAVPSSNLVDPQAAPQLATREDELYKAGTDALNDEDYDEAVSKFDQAAKLHSKKADAALYWKAYALAKTGNKSQAAAVISELRKSYPQSTWLKEAATLEVEMKGAAANPEALSSEEEKLLALNAIMQSDHPDKALPYIDKMLHSSSSTKVKERALFVLAQSHSEQAQQTLLSIAKNGNDPDLQRRAIRYIGMTGSSSSRAALKDIYKSMVDVAVKKSIFQGWLMCGCKEEVLAAAQTEKDPGLRREAIRYLGMMGARTELRAMYKSSPDADTREAVVGAMMLCGDSQSLAEIAAMEKDPKVLDKAISTLGMVGGPESLSALTNIYNSHNDVATRRRVINAMFLHGAAKEMVAMARKETNPELKKAWLQKLSLMQSPEVTDYMVEILNK
jgi:tetratricopeptide (TPR) repeat protein